MDNEEITEIFYEISKILGYKGETFKSRAYRRAARNLESIDDLQTYYENDELERIPGVGRHLAKKIREYFETGKVSYLEKVKKELPEGTEELLSVPGIGPKTASLLQKELHTHSLDDLEKAIEHHEIMKLKGEKTEKNIAHGLNLLRTTRKKIPLDEACNLVEEISGIVGECRVAGSFRRRKETVGDLDILVTDIDEEVLQDFEILERGERKITTLYKHVQVDFRIVNEHEMGSSLQYFTGSKGHNIKLRRIAQTKGYKLNEYGLFEGDTRIATSEERIYNKLGMDWIPPELRENRGEMEAALKGELPELVKKEDINGDLHIHSKWSGDGMDTIEDIVKKAKELSYEYIAITDHSPTIPAHIGMDEEKFYEQWDILESYDTVLKGVECDILKDGTLRFDDTILKKADLVIASVHEYVPTTDTVLTAMENPHVDILGHPTGRFMGRSEAYNLDMEKVFAKAVETRTALEINANPRRLDLRDFYIKKAKEYGVKFSIGTDSHSVDDMENIIFGIYNARRGWTEKKDILNCMSLEELKRYVHRV